MSKQEKIDRLLYAVKYAKHVLKAKGGCTAKERDTAIGLIEAAVTAVETETRKP